VCLAIARQIFPRFSHFNQGGSVFGVAGSRSKFAALFAVVMILGRFFHLPIPHKRNAQACHLVPKQAVACVGYYALKMPRWVESGV
jgi:hypothetical protein